MKGWSMRGWSMRGSKHDGSVVPPGLSPRLLPPDPGLKPWAIFGRTSGANSTNFGSASGADPSFRCASGADPGRSRLR